MALNMFLPIIIHSESDSGELHLAKDADGGCSCSGSELRTGRFADEYPEAEVSVNKWCDPRLFCRMKLR